MGGGSWPSSGDEDDNMFGSKTKVCFREGLYLQFYSINYKGVIK